VHAHRPYRTPSYRLHKPSGRAVVTIDGRDYYLGVHGSNESRAEYDRIIAEWLANGRRVSKAPVQAASDLSVNELLLAYLEFAEGYYRKRGVMTGRLRTSGFRSGHCVGSTGIRPPPASALSPSSRYARA
jgi:hypothetical protein